MHYRPEADVTTTSMDDGGLVLLSERSGKLYRCNAIAAAMWTTLVQQDGQPEATAAAVAERYDVAIGRVRSDLDELIDKLRTAGMLGVAS